MPDLQQLLRDAYTCNICPANCGFTPSPNGTYFKFPPLIGKTSPADILFVGINPRRTDTNLDLHHHLMTVQPAFEALAFNKLHDHRYIDTSSNEPHYHDHLTILRGIYNVDRAFDSCAAVTELFLCATKDSKTLPDPGSPCADKFLPSVLEIVQPKVIIAVGSRVLRYFRNQPGSRVSKVSLIVQFLARDFHVVKMPHPADTNLTAADRQSQLDTCIANARGLLGLF
jgi:uracil-DNA glycosylase